MKPARCTLLLSTFISTSLHVSDNYVTIIRRTYCIYATRIFHSRWLSGLLVLILRQSGVCGICYSNLNMFLSVYFVASSNLFYSSIFIILLFYN